MVKKKGFNLFIVSILSIFAVICSVTFAYSYFVFESREIEEEPQILVDDIYENYNLTKEGTLQEDFYTIYFFAQPISANASDPKTYLPSDVLSTEQNTSGSNSYKETYGSGGKYDGFFANETNISANDIELGSTSIVTKSTTIAGQNLYYCKIADNVFQGLTTDILEAVENPLCYKADSGGFDGTVAGDSTYSDSKYDLTFVGWSTNKSIANTDGYASQANFSIVDTRTPLSVYDQSDLDGTGINDKVIYLYAIYTAGKDYSKWNSGYPNEAERYDTVSVRLYDTGNKEDCEKTEYWPTRQLTDSGREYFTFSNLVLTQGQVDTGWTFGISAGPVNDQGWDGSWLGMYGGDDDPKRTGVDSGIREEGHYNIYVFVFTSRDYYDGAGNFNLWGWDETSIRAVENDYNNWHSSDVLNNFLVGKNIILQGNSGLISYAKDANFIIHYGPENHLGGFYFYVERIYEFKMIGGNSQTFDYEDTSLNYFFDQDGTNTYFEAHNVFFNNMGLDYEYKFEDGSTLQTNHSVFGVVHEKVLPTYEITLSENAQLYLEVAEEGVDYFINDLSGNNLSASLKGKLFKINYTGYFNFNLRVSYENGEISSVEIDISVRHSDMFIKITDNDLVDRNSDKFIIHNDFDSNYQRVNADGSVTKLLFESVNIYTNNFISGDWSFNQYYEYNGAEWVKLSSPLVVTLNDIINLLENSNLYLTSHLTKNRIPKSTILDPNSPFLVSKSYLWYIS